MVAIALRITPADVCLVPERREEVTTEGGLDVAGQPARTLRDAVERLRDGGHPREPLHRSRAGADRRASQQLGADAIELHTGRYARAAMPTAERAELADRAARRRAQAPAPA